VKHRKCDKCDRPATNHSVEMSQGQKTAKHLCDLHAAEEGLATQMVPSTPINELLTKIVQSQSGDDDGTNLRCEHCGLTFPQFREHSLLGCPACYEVFEAPLASLLERAHEGGTHHLGKVPHRAGSGEDRQQQMLRMRKRLAEAITSEDYELAARLRDDIQRHEEQPS